MSFFDKFKKGKKIDAGINKRVSSRALQTAAKSSESSLPDLDIESASASTAKRGNRGAAYRILLRPLVSEKAAAAERDGAYTFMIASGATKTEVASAVHAVYGVKPIAVRTVNMSGKYLRFGSRIGRRKNWKKAIVTLPKGKTISIHEGV